MGPGGRRASPQARESRDLPLEWSQGARAAVCRPPRAGRFEGRQPHHGPHGRLLALPGFVARTASERLRRRRLRLGREPALLRHLAVLDDKVGHHRNQERHDDDAADQQVRRLVPRPPPGYPQRLRRLFAHDLAHDAHHGRLGPLHGHLPQLLRLLQAGVGREEGGEEVVGGVSRQEERRVDGHEGAEARPSSLDSRRASSR
mmetsp:Transcript_36069/g.94847  ORF Transcript_36069/g.94847 Transcript_36069/m.94847 type:complete len:202 (+) Transcript_36069:164-769(+)